jgi:peptide/nickel transport system permease protein
VAFSLLIPGFILTEAGLSFLGLGINEPASSWGLMLAVAQEGGIQTFTSRPWMLLPGLFIFVTVLAFNFVGDGLRDALDPKLRT